MRGCRKRRLENEASVQYCFDNTYPGGGPQKELAMVTILNGHLEVCITTSNASIVFGVRANTSQHGD